MKFNGNGCSALTIILCSQSGCQGEALCSHCPICICAPRLQKVAVVKTCRRDKTRLAGHQFLAEERLTDRPVMIYPFCYTLVLHDEANGHRMHGRMFSGYSGVILVITPVTSLRCIMSALKLMGTHIGGCIVHICIASQHSAYPFFLGLIKIILNPFYLDLPSTRCVQA